MSINFVYITAADRAEALRIGRVLAEERLAACINVLEPMTSLYWWDGQLQEGQEAVLIAKTVGDLIPRLTDRVKLLHSYACPCIVSWAVNPGNEQYCEWIRSQVVV